MSFFTFAAFIYVYSADRALTMSVNPDDHSLLIAPVTDYLLLLVHPVDLFIQILPANIGKRRV
jgi:hypothetical protein